MRGFRVSGLVVCGLVGVRGRYKKSNSYGCLRVIQELRFTKFVCFQAYLSMGFTYGTYSLWLGLRIPDGNCSHCIGVCRGSKMAMYKVWGSGMNIKRTSKRTMGLELRA